MSHSSISKAVVDTSPLFTALTLELVRRSPRSRRSTILEKSGLPEYLSKSSSRQEAFLQFLASIRIILTTQHVIAELQGLLRREHQREFWSYGMDLLSTRGFGERLLPPLLDMQRVDAVREAVCATGPTDAGLIELARQEGCALITDDERTLARRAWQLGMDCRLVCNLIP